MEIDVFSLNKTYDLKGTHATVCLIHTHIYNPHYCARYIELFVKN